METFPKEAKARGQQVPLSEPAQEEGPSAVPPHAARLTLGRADGHRAVTGSWGCWVNADECPCLPSTARIMS